MNDKPKKEIRVKKMNNYKGRKKSNDTRKIHMFKREEGERRKRKKKKKEGGKRKQK